MGDESARIGNVLCPSPEVGKLVDFYTRGMHLAVKFRDGDRYAALDGGGVTLAVTGPDEDLTGGAVAASFRVADVPAAVARLTECGGTVVHPPSRGPHEMRASLRDPAGNLFVVYGPLPETA